MIILPNALQAWGSAAFAAALKAELEVLPANALPLEQGMTPGSHAGDEPLSVTVIATSEDACSLQVKAGVFFTEIVANCGCGDDPVHQSAYCELRIGIDKTTAAAVFAVIQD